MRLIWSALLPLMVGIGSAQADEIKMFKTLISLGGVNQYGFVADGTITIDTSTETFVGVDLGFRFITNFYNFNTIASQSSSATNIAFTSVSPANPFAPPTLVVSIAKSTFGTNPSLYSGGPIDPAGTYFFFGVDFPGPRVPPASENGTLTLVAGSEVTTSGSNIPEPGTAGLTAAFLIGAGVLRSRKRSAVRPV